MIQGDKVADEECNSPCKYPEDSLGLETCGAGWRNQVYRLPETFDDGSMTPTALFFSNWNYDYASRTFTGEISYDGKYKDGYNRWMYTIIFSSDYMSIDTMKIDHGFIGDVSTPSVTCDMTDV
jgi:hypothetical protein